jgi:excisionase family DNA binding protein
VKRQSGTANGLMAPSGDGHSRGHGVVQPRAAATVPDGPPDTLTVAPTLAGRAAMPTPRLMTLAQAAAYLSMSIWAVRELVWKGTLRAVRINRRVMLDRRDVDHLIDRAKD